MKNLLIVANKQDICSRNINIDAIWVWAENTVNSGVLLHLLHQTIEFFGNLPSLPSYDTIYFYNLYTLKTLTCVFMPPLISFEPPHLTASILRNAEGATRRPSGSLPNVLHMKPKRKNCKLRSWWSNCDLRSINIINPQPSSLKHHPIGGFRCFQPMTLRWVGMQDQEAAEKAKAAELERRKVQELRLARHRKLQKEADVAAKRRCGRGGMSWGGGLNRMLIRRGFGVLQITLAHLWIEDEWSWLSQHSIKLDAPGARTCAPPLPSAPPCWTPRQPPRRPHRGALPRRPATGTWMAQQWQGNKAPGMVGHMTYDRFVRGEFFSHYCVTMMCHLIFFGNPNAIVQTTKNICGELVNGEWLAFKRPAPFCGEFGFGPWLLFL